MAKKIFTFHGAFKSKAAAIREEKKVKHSFIQRFGYSSGARYAVLTRKRKG